MTPPFATVEDHPAGWSIETRPVVAPWARRAAWGAAVLLPATVVGMVVARGHPAALAAGVPVAAGSALFLLLRLAFAVIRCRVACDGTTLRLGTGPVTAVPVGDVRGVAVHVGPGRYTDVDLRGPPARTVSRRPTIGLDLSVPGGRLRPFGNRDPAELAWLAAELRRRLNVPADAGDDDVPVARTGRLVGPARWLILVCGVGVGLIGTGWLGWTFSLAVRSASWPTVVGRVTRSVYQETHDSRGRISYIVQFGYDYQVDGRAYSGDEVGYLRGDDERAVDDLVRDHPTGRTVPVYVRPGHASESTVLPGPGVLLWLGLPWCLITLIGSLPLCFDWPTAAETALARRYPRVPAERGSDRDGPVLHRWRVPADVWEEDRRAAVRRAAWMVARTTVLTALLSQWVWSAFQPFVPDPPATHLGHLVWGFALLPAVVLASDALLPFLSKQGPGERRITGAGVIVPGRKYPLVRWDRIATFTVVSHPVLVQRRLLLLHRREGVTHVVPLPAGTAAEAIVDDVGRRVTQGDPPARARPLTTADWTCSMLVAIAYAAALARLLATHGRELKDQVLWIMLGSLLLGPGTWAAVVLGRRRSRDQAVALAFVLNLGAMLGGMAAGAVGLATRLTQ